MVLSTKPAQQTNTQTLSFEDVPNEIVSLIFENHASVREMSVMSQVSKRYYLLFQEKIALAKEIIMAFRQVDSNLNLKWLQNTLASMSKDDLTKLQDNIQQQNQFFPQMHRKIEERKNYYSPETIQELGKLIQLDVETLIQSIEKKEDWMQLLADKNPLILYYAAMKMLACLHPRDDNPEVIKLTVVLLSVAHVLSKQDHLLAYIANLSLNHSLTGNYMIDVNVHYFNLFSARLGVNLSDARNNTTELQLILPSLQFILAQVSSKFYQKLPVLVHLLGKFGITGTLNLAPILRQVMHYSTDADYIKAKIDGYSFQQLSQIKSFWGCLLEKSPISDANELAPTLSDNEFTAKLQVLEVHASATKNRFLLRLPRLTFHQVEKLPKYLIEFIIEHNADFTRWTSAQLNKLNSSIKEIPNVIFLNSAEEALEIIQKIKPKDIDHITLLKKMATVSHHHLIFKVIPKIDDLIAATKQSVQVEGKTLTLFDILAIHEKITQFIIDKKHIATDIIHFLEANPFIKKLVKAWPTSVAIAFRWFDSINTMQDFHSRKLSDENWYPGNVLLITNERKKSLVTVLDLLLASIDLFEYMDIRPFFTDNLDFFHWACCEYQPQPLKERLSISVLMTLFRTSIADRTEPLAAYLFKSSHDPAIIENLVKHYTNTQGIIDIDGLCSIISTGFIDAIRNAAISLQKTPITSIRRPLYNVSWHTFYAIFQNAPHEFSNHYKVLAECRRDQIFTIFLNQSSQGDNAAVACINDPFFQMAAKASEHKIEILTINYGNNVIEEMKKIGLKACSIILSRTCSSFTFFLNLIHFITTNKAVDVNKIEQVQCHLLPLFSQIKESVCQYNLEIVGMKFSVPDLIRLAKEPTNLSQFPSMLFMILNCEPGKQGAPALTNILAGNIDFILQNKQQIIGLLKPLQYVSKPTYTPDTPGIFQVKRQDAPVTTPTQSNIKKQKTEADGNAANNNNGNASNAGIEHIFPAEFG